MAAVTTPDYECSFTDAEQDKIRLTAEVRGNRGRVALYHNGAFFKFIREMVFVPPESKLYVNGHEAVIVLPLSGREDTLASIETTCTTGKVQFACADTYDAASALAKVRQAEMENMEEELAEMTPAMAAKARANAERKAAKKKRVPQENLTKLMEMGVSEVRAMRAFALCEGTTVESATSYLEKCAADPNLDTPVDAALLPEFTAKLTEEEIRLKAKELQDKIEEKKRAQKEAERKRVIEVELKRREVDKQNAEIKEEYEKKKRMEAYDARKREKDADIKAKAEIRARIQADRAAKGWDPLPDEVEEKKAAPKPASEIFKKPAAAPSSSAADWDPMRLSGAPPAAPSRVALPSTEGYPVPGISLTEAALLTAIMKVKHLPDTVKTLKAYISNIANDPFNQKFRAIKTTNAVFTRTVLAVDGAAEVLLLMGFRPVGEKLTLTSTHIPTFKKALTLLE